LDPSFEISDLVPPALGEILHVLSGRGHIRSDAERQATANRALMLILSFQPRDAVELTLAGQTVLFNEVLADSARMALRVTTDADKQKSIASVVNMAKLVQGHVDRLEKRGNQPARPEIVVAREEQPNPVPEAEAAVREEAAVPSESPPISPGPEAMREIGILAGAAETEWPEAADEAPEEMNFADTSPPDEPPGQLTIETRSDFADEARIEMELEALARAVLLERAAVAARAGLSPDPDPAPPRQPEGRSRARMLVDAEMAGD
jgi:hypothetical protein